MSLIQSYTGGTYTRLKFLKYGDDGITEPPLVTKPIPFFPDERGSSTNPISARVDDLTRITKLMTRSSGQIWLAKQGLLDAQQTHLSLNPNKTSVGFFKALGKNLVGTLGVLGSTLAQVPVSGTGIHFVRGFIGSDKKYLTDGLSINPDRNRLLDAEKWTTLSKGIIPTKQTPTEYWAKYKMGVGNPGRTSIDGKVRTVLDDYSIDDELQLIKDDNVNSLPPSKSDTFPGLNDFVPLKFTIISSDGQPANNINLQFRAFLDNFADNFSGTWNSFNYVGRGEQFHTYNTFNRTISLGFKIAAQTRNEMRPLYQKVVALASSTAPTYNNGFMKGTLVKLTVGDYLYELPGYIGSVNYSWQTEYPWEITLDRDGKDFDQQILPMVLGCTVNFTPIHTFIPQTGFYNYITSTTDAKRDFIGKANTLGTQPTKIPPTPSDNLNIDTPFSDNFQAGLAGRNGTFNAPSILANTPAQNNPISTIFNPQATLFGG